MCKHKSGGMSKSSAANHSENNTNEVLYAPSTSKSTVSTQKANQTFNNEEKTKHCSQCNLTNMGTKQTEFPHGNHEDLTSQDELSNRILATKLLQPSPEKNIKSTRSQSVPEIPVPNVNINCDKKSNNYLNVTDKFKSLLKFYDCVPLNSEISLIDGRNKTEYSFPVPKSRSSSLVPSFLYGQHQIYVSDVRKSFKVSNSSSLSFNVLPAPLQVDSVSKVSISESRHEIPKHTLVIPISAAPRWSLSSSFSECGGPVCKICHGGKRDDDPLITPCRCSGTMQYIHCGCLVKWLEISSKKSKKAPKCELCQYQYQWHKKFKVHELQFPHCSRRDIVLHTLFFISIFIMIACAAITILCFKQEKGIKFDPERIELTNSEITTLICGVLFFLAFFVGMYVEVKARTTIYKLLIRFIYLNQQWYINEYRKKENVAIAV